MTSVWIDSCYLLWPNWGKLLKDNNQNRAISKYEDPDKTTLEFLMENKDYPPLIEALAQKTWIDKFGTTSRYDPQWPVVSDGNEKFEKDKIKNAMYKDKWTIKAKSTDPENIKFMHTNNRRIPAILAPNYFKNGVECKVLLSLYAGEFKGSLYIGKNIVGVQLLSSEVEKFEDKAAIEEFAPEWMLDDYVE